jgi:glycosyltransferase involved in cell wall biosynthesis
MEIYSWDDITIESYLYTEWTEFVEITKNSSKDDISLLLKEKIVQAYDNKNLDLALMWLNEYQLLNKNDSFTYEYEHKIAPMYDSALAAVKRPCTFFATKCDTSPITIKDFHNKFSGERCFIIGNGPSLNDIDIATLNNEFTFGVNSIFLLRDRTGFEPTFYCVEDTHVANDRKQEIFFVNSSLKFFGLYLQEKILTHPSNLFLNILMDYRIYKGFPYFSVDASRRLWVGGTVSYINMQLAYYMGFSAVYLVGFDHSYVVPDSAILDKSNILSTTDDTNHFHPDYFGKGYNWHMPLVNRMELSYIKAKRAFELDGRRIVNCTPRGNLEVFDRENFYDVMSNGKLPKKTPREVKNYVEASSKQRYPGDVQISVIVPAYNVKNCLLDTLASIDAQSFRAFELIIVNDGSTDATLQVAENYASRFPNARVISQENKGLGGARNTGMQNARGKYCTFVDSDDLIKPDMLLQLFTEAEKTCADIVRCGYERQAKGKTIKKVSATFGTTGIDALIELSVCHSFSACGKLYRIDFLRNYEIFFQEYVYHEDIEFTLKAHYFATNIRCIEPIGYIWLVRDGSITSNVRNKHIEDVTAIIDNIKQFYIKENIFELLHRRYYILCYRIFFIILERIYKEKGIWQRTLLLRTLRHALELNNLDYYDYITSANSIYKKTNKIFGKSFLISQEWGTNDVKLLQSTLIPRHEKILERYRSAGLLKKFFILILLDPKLLISDIRHKIKFGRFPGK